MPTNDFVPYATGSGANVETQSEYLADPALSEGVLTGRASSALYNKTARQGNFMAAVIGQFIVNALGVDCLDDGNVNGKVFLFASAILEQTNIYAPINNPVFTGTPEAPVPANANDNSTIIPTTSWVQALLAFKANIASPSLTGTPRSTTPPSSDNSTRIATTAMVQGALGAFESQLGLSKGFSTGLQSVNTPSVLGPFTHGLGRAPVITRAYLVCQTTDGPFNPGDIVETSYGGFSTESRGAQFTQMNATTFSIAFGAQSITVCSPTSGAVYGINNSKWGLVGYAFA